jgi:TctA family transporter
MSSVIGAVFGVLVLVAAIPIARPLMLSIGSPELFMLALLGITFIAPLAAPAPVKGLIAGAVGLFLATIGLDSIEGQPRYTFDILFLWDGIGVLPLILGLFAIPEALALVSSRNTVPSIAPADAAGVRAGIVDTIRHWALVLRCSAIGTIIGMLPGMGASVAQWVAYAHATGRLTHDGHHGRIEGVLGPGAANNATLGGALIPTLVIGVPGSVQTAILLSALVIKGIIPGDRMLLPESEGGHLSFVFSLVAFIVAANIIVVAISVGFVDSLSRVMLTRNSLLFPGVVVLTLLGAFAEKNAVEDLLVVAAAGALGWMMVRLDWPRPPLLLGLVLGPLAENRLFLSTSLYGWSWWQRPGVILIGLLILAIVGVTLFRRGRIGAIPLVPSKADEAVAPVRRKPDVAFVIGIIVVAIVAFAMSQEFGARAAVFPQIALALIIILSLMHLATMMVTDDSRRTTGSPLAPSAPGWIGAFIGAVWVAGFTIGAPLMVLAYLRLGAGERWSIALVHAATAFALLDVVFRQVLHIPFPAGVLFEALGAFQ